MPAHDYRQALFVHYYLGQAQGNATLAAKLAGFSEKHVTNLLRNPAIAAKIEAKLGEAGLSGDEILARLSDQATGSYEHFLTVEQEVDPRTKEPVFDAKGEPVLNARIDLAKAAKLGKLHLIKKLVPHNKYGLIPELYDAQAALVRLGVNRGLWNPAADEQLGDVSSMPTDKLRDMLNQMRRSRRLGVAS